MPAIDAWRDPVRVRTCLRRIERRVTRPWTLMELCGGQTHAIVRHGIDQLLPEGITLVHGPGCPVCVTPIALIDAAIALAERQGVILASFGDMARVPGSDGSLLAARARGADVRLVYSPLDALTLARDNPAHEVVFFAVGFETTAPTSAVLAERARRDDIPNLSLLVAHVLVPPAMRAILDAPGNTVQGFLAAGHVCTIMGDDAYRPIAVSYRVPIVVTGFEPVDILQGIAGCVEQLEEGRHDVDNSFARVARDAGNPTARALLLQVFEPVQRHWRGIGEIPLSGLGLTRPYAHLDAALRFGLATDMPEPASRCIAGAVLQGRAAPDACPDFGTGCTPEHPLGAPMVSSEGACAAYHAHRRHRIPSLTEASA